MLSKVLIKNVHWNDYHTNKDNASCCSFDDTMVKDCQMWSDFAVLPDFVALFILHMFLVGLSPNKSNNTGHRGPMVWSAISFSLD